MSNTSIDGLVSGLSTSTLIAQLMELERQPQVRLAARRDAANSLSTSYQTLNGRLAALKDAAAALGKASAWQVRKATSSDEAAATASATASAAPGSLSFLVDRLAGTHSLVSLGSVASTSTVVATPASRLFLARAGALGFASLRSSAGLAPGSHEVKVTQASSGASQAGTALASSVTVASGAQLRVALNGTTTTTHTFTLTAGTYSRQQLADMVSTASGGLLKATVAGNGALKLATAREGSAARLAVTQANATLGLAITAASAGGDGIVTVDGAATTVTDTSLASLTLSAGGGNSLVASFAGGLRLGTVTGSNVDAGDGTLASVVSAVNGANAGMTAAAFQSAPGVYRLQVTSTASGAAGALSLDATPFAGALGIFDTLAAAADAQISIGGAGGLRVTSASNTFTDVVPGVSVTALRASTTQTVTVSVADDANALADQVQKLVDAVNGVFSHIRGQSAWNAETRKAGILMGDATARQVEEGLHRTVQDLAAGTSLKSVGLSVGKDGSLAFDKAAFLSAYQASPATVAGFFHDAGTLDEADDGLGKRLESMAKAATDSVSGLVTAAIAGRKSEVASLDRAIDDWDVRLARREQTLRRQFAALETALGTLQNQSNWLAGQLAGLPTFGSE